MSKNYTCKDHFPTWYKTIELNLTPDILQKRISAIEKIIQEENVELWLDIVKLAYGIVPGDQNNKDLVVDIFKEFDLSFPIQANDNIVKVLSQICLCFLFESKSHLRQIVSLAIINLNFFEQYSSVEVPFYESAHKTDVVNETDVSFDVEEAVENLTIKAEALEEDEDGEEGMENEDTLNLINLVRYLSTENKKLKEETNVLWWLFTQYSNLNKAYFYELTLSKMVISSAYELFQITQNSGFLNSSKHILNKALIISNGNKTKLKELSLADVINETLDTVKDGILALGDQSEFTPFLHAVNLEKSLGDLGLYKATFNKKFGAGSIEKKFKPEELAFQFYAEMTFIKSLQSR